MRIARLSPAASRTLTHRVYQIKANQAPQIRAPNVHEVRQVDDSIDSASAGKNRPRTIQPAACKPPGSSVYDLQCTNAPGCKDTWHNGTWPIMRIPESKTLNVELVDLTKGTQGPKPPEDRTKRARSLGLKDGLSNGSSPGRTVAPGVRSHFRLCNSSGLVIISQPRGAIASLYVGFPPCLNSEQP